MNNKLILLVIIIVIIFVLRKKQKKKLKREKEREKIIPLKIENTYQLEEFGKKYFKEIFDELSKVDYRI